MLRQQHSQLRRGLRGLRREGFHRVYVLSGEAEIDAAVGDQREPLWNDRRDQHGPFDVIGDVHGCYDELVLLLGRLGYQVTRGRHSRRSHPDGRTAIFVGDLVDRGPATPAVLRLVMGMTASRHRLCVAGNHEAKLVRALRGRNVTVRHGLAESLAQLAPTPARDSPPQATAFMDGLLGHLVLDDGKLVVAHAGLPEAMHGRASAAVRSFALYGDTTGETDEYGLPVRYPWAEDYRGRAMVVYGHTPVPEARVGQQHHLHRHRLRVRRQAHRAALPRARTGQRPGSPGVLRAGRPLAPTGSPAAAASGPGAGSARDAAELNIDDVIGKRIVQTRLTGGTVTIREENAIAALEVMSRFAIDPRWLIYLPPTMAPTATTSQPGLLEHPGEALAAFRAAGVPEVVCEEKHMGSRAVVVACRDDDAAVRRFGMTGLGAIYTRTGRPFFTDRRVEAGVAGPGRSPLSPPPGSGRSWTPTGWRLTAS